MAIRDENGNKIAPLQSSADKEKVSKTAIWKTNVKEAMLKIDHGRYEYSPNSEYQKTAIEITKIAQRLPMAGKTNFMIFIKPPVEQLYSSVSQDACKNAHFALVVIRHKGTGCFNDPTEFYNLMLFGLKDKEITQKPTVLGIDCLTIDKNSGWRSEKLRQYMNEFISKAELKISTSTITVKDNEQKKPNEKHQRQDDGRGEK